MTLPVIALAIGGASAVATAIRGSSSTPSSATLRRSPAVARPWYPQRGLHARPAQLDRPTFAVLNVQFIGMLGGAVIVEQVFQMPGLGQLAVGATTQGDIPIVMGLVVATALIT